MIYTYLYVFSEFALLSKFCAFLLQYGKYLGVDSHLVPVFVKTSIGSIGLIACLRAIRVVTGLYVAIV